MSIVLTAGGKAPIAFEAQADAYAEWKSAVTAMLAAAVKTKPAKDRLDQMKAWLDEKPFDDRFNERHQQHHLELMDYFGEWGRVIDLSVKVEHWQHRLTDERKQVIGAWLGIELRPTAYQWAVTAQWIGSADLREIVKVGAKEEVPF